jgi:phospholipid N-methyltransferase
LIWSGRITHPRKRKPANVIEREYMSDSTPSGLRQTWLFARNFFKYPNMLGWVLPSSRFLVGRLLRQVDWNQARLIVEYGPGVGTFTRQILDRMAPGATLVAFETNGEFVQFLRHSLPDPRLHVVHASALEVNVILARLGRRHADYVISGIPFKTLPDDLREPIVRATHGALRPQGAFLVYQFSRAVLPYLQRVFGNVHQDFEPLNILPARLFYCIQAGRNGEGPLKPAKSSGPNSAARNRSKTRRSRPSRSNRSHQRRFH